LSSVFGGLRTKDLKQIRAALIVAPDSAKIKNITRLLEISRQSNLPLLTRVGGLINRKKLHEKLDLDPADPISQLYDASYFRVAPSIIASVDQMLKGVGDNGANSEFFFLARDGLGAFNIAKILLGKFPERYPGVRENQLHYVYVNRKTIYSEFMPTYLEQNGLTPGKTAHFFDLGWFGSMYSELKEICKESGAQLGGMYLVFNDGSKKNIHPFHETAFKPNHPPIHDVEGIPAVHFLEDTFSGFETRPNNLIQETASGKIVTSQTQRYSGDKMNKRSIALLGLHQAAQDIETTEELDSLSPSHTSGILFPFLEEINQGKHQNILVPHEHH
jgi:hypothetical protein